MAYGNVNVPGVTASELDAVKKTAEAAQTAANGKANASHKHTTSEITDFPTSMTPTSHTHKKSEISDFPTNMTPTSHAVSATTYGAGNGTNYGHVKLSDSTNSASGASAGIAATPAAVKSAYDLANEARTAVNELKTFALAITFSASMKGKAFTVTGSGMTTHNGTVPDTLSATVAVPNANTTYTVTCDGKSKTVTVGSYYGLYSVYVDTISTVLAENSWAQIAAVSAAGNAENYWKVGDEKDIVVNGETLTLQIYGFNHDDLTGGGKAGITFGMKNLMATTRRMEATSTNANGFTGSEMYDWLQNTLFPSLPAELQSCIKAVDKKTSAGNKSTTINIDSMKLFLFSAIENGLRTTTDVYKDEGETYPIFTDNTSRIKYLSNGSGAAYYWWERSPNTTYATYFCSVISGGNAGSYFASNSCGVCFGFCV